MKKHLKAASYLPALGLSMAIMMARMLIYAKVLSVQEFASLSFALIISTIVVTLVAFGLYTDLQRKLPIDFQRGETTTGSARIALTTAASLLVAGISLILAAGLSMLGALPFLLASVGVLNGLGQQTFLIASAESRSAGETMRYSLQSFLRAVLIMGIALPATVGTGSAIVGLAVETVISLIVAAVIFRNAYRRYVPSLPELAGSVTSLARNINPRSMFVLVLFAFAMAASMNIDRWLAAKYLSVPQFAHYSFAAIVMILAYSAQAMLNAAIYPTIARRMALSPPAALRFTAIASIICMGAGLLAALPAIYIAKWLIGKYYPDYADSALLIIPLTIAAVLRISDYWTSYIVIAGRERMALIISIFSVAVPVLGWIAVGSASMISIAYLTASIAACALALSVVAGLYVGRQRHHGEDTHAL